MFSKEYISIIEENNSQLKTEDASLKDRTNHATNIMSALKAKL